MTSRFVDKVKVYVKAGDGGRGCVAFRREKYVPFGGPSGGDGGDGGSVIFKVDPGLVTLLDFKYHPHLKAQNGRPGEGDKRSGKKGDDLVVLVPPGTVVKSAETGEILADLCSPGETFVAARGGRGGRGNARFATSVNRAPRKFEEGTPGEEKYLELELKSIADVGLVGFPNAGKSTLLRAISNATPEVGPYPFTTLTPHLGVVQKDNSTLVCADIPGLIEGASQGKGLGLEFLRHIERTLVLLYVIDAQGFDGNPVNDYLCVRREIMAYSESMRKKDSLVALNKIDLIESDSRLSQLIKELEEVSGKKVYPISAQTGKGIDELISALFETLKVSKKDL